MQALNMGVASLSATDIIAIIGAVGLLMTTTITAVTGAIIAIRTGQIQRTGEQAQQTGVETHQMVDGTNSALRALVQKQSEELHDAGLPPTQDDSLEGRNRNG